ncbi:M48 family metalloprotease [Sphingobacterium sp. UT-1RO-CII-1]|uniref:M48 family metallopeptidase n=1 Tax=Sphingobacterium sp. UT-1RO-CII-1 TaxID=2995225 RepID=UPI00227C6A70|nr:M48 family metallopeptidase [Sphingobacterium sp. UT-1RO-CII-1]MCY4781192.1 M48 family metalloprotease [Sphingobacterium sp. UT-1RO-CII-1]
MNTIHYFFIGVALSIAIYIVRFIAVFCISKYYKVETPFELKFSVRDLFFESIIVGLLFLIFGFLSTYLLKGFSSLLITTLVLSLFPTYFYVFKPIQYLIKKHNIFHFQNPDKDSQELIKKYSIKIVDTPEINAYATGIFPFSKTILITKPLLDNLTKEELQSILLHEVGHLKRNHLFKLYIVVLILTVFSGFLFQMRTVLFTDVHFVIDLASVFITGCLMGLLLWYLPGKVQYRFELSADKFAAKINGPHNLISALQKLDNLTAGEVSKGGITHPTLSKRISHINCV